MEDKKEDIKIEDIQKELAPIDTEPKIVVQDFERFIDEAGISFFYDQDRRIFLEVELDNRVEVHSLNDGWLRGWLMDQCYELLGKLPNTSLLDSYMELLAFQVLQNLQLKKAVELRLAEHENEIWYDMGRPDWRFVRINKDGWSLEDYFKSPVKFYRHEVQVEQKLPQKPSIQESVDHLNKLQKLINIQGDREFRFFLSYLISLFIPNLPHFIMSLSGPAGSGKTTATSFVKQLVDPTKTLRLFYSTDNEDGFTVACSQNYLLSFDNLNGLRYEDSDRLCRVVTGESISKRKLYTDNDSFYLNYRRVLCLNGINQVPEKEDLLSRTLVFELSRITDRTDERLLLDFFEENRGHILGALFNMVQQVLAMDNTEYQIITRMADNEIWMAKAYVLLGGNIVEFQNVLQGQINGQENMAIESSTLANLIIELMDKQGLSMQWSGSPSKLFQEITSLARTNSVERAFDLPKAPNGLMRKLNEIKLSLAKRQIIVEVDRTERQKIITISTGGGDTF